MKKMILIVLAVLVIACLTACGNEMNTDNNINTNDDTSTIIGNITEINTEDDVITQKPTNEEMYGDLISDYENALSEYDLNDLDIDEKIANKYELISTTLLMHITRYANDGVELTFSYTDIDKNGIDELLVGASDSIGAIYSFDENTNKPVKIFFQSTLERGNLSVYDNGIILSEGAGGAALHYYEFGKIATDGISYELLEAIEEEYLEGSETPVYRNSETNQELEYKSLDEIMNKYQYMN